VQPSIETAKGDTGMAGSALTQPKVQKVWCGVVRLIAQTENQWDYLG